METPCHNTAQRTTKIPLILFKITQFYQKNKEIHLLFKNGYYIEALLERYELARNILKKIICG